jgi:hypothetical protein
MRRRRRTEVPDAEGLGETVDLVHEPCLSSLLGGSVIGSMQNTTDQKNQSGKYSKKSNRLKKRRAFAATPTGRAERYDGAPKGLRCTDELDARLLEPSMP